MKFSFKVDNSYDNLLYKLFNDIDENDYIWEIENDQVFKKDLSFLFDNNIFFNKEFKKIINEDKYYIVSIDLKLYDKNKEKLFLKLSIVDNIFVDIFIYNEEIFSKVKKAVKKYYGKQEIQM